MSLLKYFDNLVLSITHEMISFNISSQTNSPSIESDNNKREAINGGNN